MKRSLCLILIFVWLYPNNSVFTQSVDLDSARVDRIANTCQLWGHINYFHPYLNDNSIDWESAFTDNIEDVIYANNRQQLADAIQKMLDPLDDPATIVLEDQKTESSADTLKHPIIEYIQDSVLLVSINDYADLEDFNYCRSQFSNLPEKMGLSNGVIFDIRSVEDIGGMKGYLSWYFGSIEESFSKEDIQLPGYKARFYDGFEPETGTTSGGYSSGSYIKGDKIVSPGPKSISKPFVFIVNENSEIPVIALGLQMAGKAKIVSQHSLTDASLVGTINFQLDDSVSVSIRQNELQAGASLKEDYLLSPNADDAHILEIAKQLIKGETISGLSHSNSQEKSKKVNEFGATKATKSSYPNKSERLLAAAKIWSVVHYFFAYQDLMTKDWDEVLRQSIPLFINASDSLEYHLAVAKMYKNIEDGHGFIRSRTLNQFFGQASPPIKIRYIEDKPVIVGLLPDSISDVGGLKIGDIILEVDGEKVENRFSRHAQHIAISNESSLKNVVSRRLLNGNDSTDVLIKVQKGDNTTKLVSLFRNTSYSRQIRQFGNDRNDQDITRLINEDIGYADLDRLTSDAVEQMFVDFKESKAIIFDMRGYPNGTAWTIAPQLTDKQNVGAANFRRYSPMGINTGRSKQMGIFEQEIPAPRSPTYMGKTFMLIDERTVSQAEHTGLFFESANNTVFIGSQTAGANGDVTNFQIPGNMILNFSGHDVRHIDGRQLQKIGLVPELEVKPTIDGIRKGRDEVLEKAIEFVKRSIAED